MKKKPLAFHSTGCFIGILIMVYRNPHRTGQYNSLYTLNNPFFHCSGGQMAASAPGNDANNFTLHRQDSISHCTHHASLCNFQLVVFPVKMATACVFSKEKNVGHFFSFLGMKLKLKPFKLQKRNRF